MCPLRRSVVSLSRGLDWSRHNGRFEAVVKWSMLSKYKQSGLNLNVSGNGCCGQGIVGGGAVAEELSC